MVKPGQTNYRMVKTSYKALSIRIQYQRNKSVVGAEMYWGNSEATSNHPFHPHANHRTLDPVETEPVPQ